MTTYAFSVLDQTFAFREVSLDTDGLDLSQTFAFVRLSDSAVLLSPVSNAMTMDGVKWKCLKLEGEYGFSVFGVLAEVSQFFASARIPVLAFSDYRTDYFAVQEQHLANAIEGLRKHGNKVLSREESDES